MEGVRSAVKAAVVATAVLLMCVFGRQVACAQIGQDDIVIGASVESETLRVYSHSTDTWSNGPGWSPTYLQSTEFDNSGGISHNASGNLLSAGFGNSYYGFEVYNLATDGSSSSESVWSIVEATGGTKGTDPAGAWLSIRGGGVSVSPDNSLLAWTCSDTGEIFVHDYSAGATPGTGDGASITGPRRTGLGDGAGNPGVLSALKTAGGQGSAWLNDTTVAVLNGFGELITLDVSGQVGGSEDGTMVGWAPTVMTNWKIANNEVSFDAQCTDIEYNALIDPDHIYASVTKNAAYEAELFAYDYDAQTGSITLDTRMVVPSPPIREPREIAFDSEGNLFYSGYAGTSNDDIMMLLPDATNIAAWDPANIQVFYSDAAYSPFNGMDVAASLAPVLYGDYNDDGQVDAADYTVWRDTLEASGTSLANDPTPGTVDESDFLYWKAHFGESASSGAGSVVLPTAAVPEPGTLVLLVVAMGMMAQYVRRRTSGRVA
jgi:hypothetical protein